MLNSFDFIDLLDAAEWDGSGLPKGLNIRGDLNLYHSKVASLPEGLDVGRDLVLIGCAGLASLPEGLKVRNDLRLDDCASLTSLPEGLKVGGGLSLDGCAGLARLPESLEAEYLSLLGCAGLPDVLRLAGGVKTGHLFLDSRHVLAGQAAIKGSIYVDGIVVRDEEGLLFVTGTSIPRSLAERRLAIEEFRGLDAEQRRVAVKMMGVKWLVDNSRPEAIDVDHHDLNGQRCLLRMRVPRTVPLVGRGEEVDCYCCLVCGDPSTGRVYYMEVPPGTKTCQEADAYLNADLDQRRQVGRT